MTEKRKEKKRKEKGKELITQQFLITLPLFIPRYAGGPAKKKNHNRSNEEIPDAFQQPELQHITVREKIAPSDPSLSTEMFQLFRCHHLKGQTTTRKEKIKKVVAADET